MAATAMRREYFARHGFELSYEPSPRVHLPKTLPTLDSFGQPSSSSRTGHPNPYPTTLARPSPAPSPSSAAALATGKPAPPGAGEMGRQQTPEGTEQHDSRRQYSARLHQRPSRNVKVDSSTRTSRSQSRRRPPSHPVPSLNPDNPRPKEFSPSLNHPTPKSYQLNLPPPPPTRTTLAFPSTKIAPPDLLVLRPNRPIPRGRDGEEGSEDEDEDEEIVPPFRQVRPAPPRDADLLARQQRAHKLSSTLDRSGLGPRSPRVALIYSPPRPDPLPPPHPTIAATVADFALSVSPSGPLHPGSKIVIEVRLGDLEIVRRLDGTLPPLFVEVEGVTLLAADFADEADVQEHVFFRDFFEDNVGEDGEDSVCYQAVLPRGGACSSCGTHSATFPPSFGPQDLESGTPHTSTVWTVRAAWGPQNEQTVVLDVRAPSEALDALLQDAKPSKIPFSSDEIVQGVQGKWSGFDLDDGSIEFTAHPLNRDDSLLTIDVGLSFRFHPSATPADLETLLDRLKPSANRGELYAALLDYPGDHLANLPGFVGEDLTAPLKVSLEVVGAHSADASKQRVRVRLRLGVQAPLSQCRPFSSCAGYRVEYRCKLSLGQLAYPGGVRDGMFLDFPLFQDDELKEVLSSEAGSKKGRRRTSWWCGLPALWSKAKEIVWGNE